MGSNRRGGCSLWHACPDGYVLLGLIPPHNTPPQIGGGIWPTSPICSADLLGFWILPTCSANLWGFCDLADSFCRLVGASGILGHLIWRCHTKMCSFNLFLLPTKRRVCGSLGFIVPTMIKISCGTSTLMLVRGQLVSCVFALHAPARSSATILQAPHRQPPKSVDSGLPSGPLFVCGAATSLATESMCTVPYPVAMHCAHAVCPCSVPMHCAHALCPCTVPMCPCTVPYPVPMHCAHAWNLGLSSLQCLLQSLLLLPQGLVSSD